MSMSDAEATRLDAIEHFNRVHSIGTPVLFWPGVRMGEGRQSRTRSQAQLLGDTPVIWVEGYAGCIAVTHVQLIGGTS